MEFLNKILFAVVGGIIDSILYLFDKLADLIGDIAAVIVFLGSYLISVILLGILSVRYFRKKKYLTSLFFLMIPLLMLGSIITLIYNLINKSGF
ncbi:MAG: hypothetical protein V1773_02170 [bacterium]